MGKEDLMVRCRAWWKCGLAHRVRLFAVVTLVLATPLTAVADYYRVTVTRKAQDVYRDDSSGTLIITRYCYEYAYADRAVLKWEGRYGDNWITFSSGSRCSVDTVR